MQSPRILRYLVLPTSVGPVFVLMSAEGVVDVMLVSADAVPNDQVHLLNLRFPDAHLVPDDGSHIAWASAVVERIDGRRADVGAPVDLLSAPWPSDTLRAIAV